jgi:quinol monooxygenase YgiN
MSNAVHWMLEARIKDGEFDNFKIVMHDMVKSTRTEPGTTNYEWFLGDDGTTLHVYERYVDSEATMTHVAAFHEKFAERLLSVIEPTSFVCYGHPDHKCRAVLDGFGAVYMDQVGGFAR